jgi:hypothetical protein
MSGLFRAGQLVSMASWTNDGCDLFNAPGMVAKSTDERVRVIGRLDKHDVGLIVALERADGGSVYVIGPHGGGWAFGAFLVVVEEAKP